MNYEWEKERESERESTMSDCHNKNKNAVAFRFHLPAEEGKARMHTFCENSANVNKETELPD